MKERIFIILALIALAITPVQAGEFCVYEANYPGVKDYNVRVDTASLTIRPQGAYIEMDLEVTVSYDFQSWFFKNYTELEFLWQFSLPDQAVVDDFWIWVGDSILRPTIMDKWTAELLFSEVSSPVRNPGLLTQAFPDREGQVMHYLRLYPIVRNEKRKFKIHYLLPARPTNETLRVWLPTSQLTSRLSPGADSLKILFLDEHKPTFIGAEPGYETYQPELPGWEFKIGLDFDRFVELVYPTPITGKYFFSTFEDSSETFYQLAVYPPEVEEVRTPRNFLILVDFNRFNTESLDGELVLLLLKETMQQALSNQDSVNILVSYEDIVYGADRLLAGTESNIDRLFENVLQRSFPSYSNFQVLIAAAAEFLESRYDSTEIILLTNTDEISLSPYSKEELADEIIAMFAPGTKIHIVDLENKSYLVYNYYSSQYETQLQSFYARICYQSAGNLFFLRYHAIKNILAALFYERISHFEEVEVQTRFATGYAYGKHFLALHEGYYPMRFPIIQVGRYRGTLPLEVTVLGKVRLDKAVDTFTITQEDVLPGTNKLAT
ncbi:MAG: VIT domain-containing protein, partial [candidate division KSB1 bacterium]|nr:VIT domain-containing protein [candidate division KSB1 bacterium]